MTLYGSAIDFGADLAIVVPQSGPGLTPHPVGQLASLRIVLLLCSNSVGLFDSCQTQLRCQIQRGVVFLVIEISIYTYTVKDL